MVKTESRISFDMPGLIHGYYRSPADARLYYGPLPVGIYEFDGPTLETIGGLLCKVRELRAAEHGRSSRWLVLDSELAAI